MEVTPSNLRGEVDLIGANDSGAEENYVTIVSYQAASGETKTRIDLTFLESKDTKLEIYFKVYSEDSNYEETKQFFDVDNDPKWSVENGETYSYVFENVPSKEQIVCQCDILDLFDDVKPDHRAKAFSQSTMYNT